MDKVGSAEQRPKAHPSVGRRITGTSTSVDGHLAEPRAVGKRKRADEDSD